VLTVLKCGGAAGVEPGVVCAAVAGLVAGGEQVVLVHGGSAETARLAARLGVPRRELTGPDGRRSRYTDGPALEVLTLALAGQVKPALLVALGRLGVPAVGLTGLDAGLLRARRTRPARVLLDGRPVVVRDDRSGRIREVAAAPLRTLLDAGYVPVLSPPARAEDGEPVNVDADRVAAAVAVALAADRLVLCTAAPGVLADPADETSVLEHYRVGAGRDPAVGGGMAAKLEAAAEALRGGVRRVLVADGRDPDALGRALAGRAGTAVLAGTPA
jgi:[amino group carrier protein]-L-2-aminoadipate 6-kinase